MIEQGDAGLLDNPVAQHLLASTMYARFAYVVSDCCFLTRLPRALVEAFG